MAPARVRFAPSPTGRLHIGTARTALFNWLYARHQGGAFILRVEDTDRERSTNEHELDILADLQWLGLDWDEGPDIGGPYGPYRQSERLEAGSYSQAFERLGQVGALYECYCSPEELEAERQAARDSKQMPKYSGRCRQLTTEERQVFRDAGRRPSLRFAVPAARVIRFDDLIRGKMEFGTDVIGDFIVARADGMPTYNLAAVVDDAGMAITHVIRGEDHLTNTARQALIFEALGLELPAFAHLSMILGPDKTKLSKRHGAAAVSDYCRQGYLSQALLNNLALLSWSAPDATEVMDADEIVRAFSLARVSKSPPIFDGEKLRWFNAQHLRRLDLADLANLTFLQLPPEWSQAISQVGGMERWQRIVAAIRTNLEQLTDVRTYAKIFFELDYDMATRERLATSVSTEIRHAAAAALADRDVLTLDQAKAFVAQVKDEMSAAGHRPKEIFQTLRLALTGQLSGPEVYFLPYALGPAECRVRLSSIDGD